MTCPRSQSQSARLQLGALSVPFPVSHQKRNTKLSVKVAERDLLRRPSSALLLEKGREQEWSRTRCTAPVPTCCSAQPSECHLWKGHGYFKVGSQLLPGPMDHTTSSAWAWPSQVVQELLIPLTPAWPWLPTQHTQSMLLLNSLPTVSHLERAPSTPR